MCFNDDFDFDCYDDMDGPDDDFQEDLFEDEFEPEQDEFESQMEPDGSAFEFQDIFIFGGMIAGQAYEEALDEKEHKNNEKDDDGEDLI